MGKGTDGDPGKAGKGENSPLSANASPEDHDPPLITWFAAATTYLGYAVLIIVGRLRDIFGPYFNDYAAPKRSPPGKAPLVFPSENFYTRRMYYRVQEAFNRPVKGSPGANIQVVSREKQSGNPQLAVKQPLETTKCLNLGSYNYLGFADDWQGTCGEDVKNALVEWPVGLSSSRMELGTCTLHCELEALVARFLGKEDAIVYNMGFATNATTIPAICNKGDLIVSDALNHTSIVNGARSSGALTRIFKHNDVEDLEAVLRDAIAMGQPRTRRPWRKIIVAVEGIYSMEGNICNLKVIAAACKKYKCYLYLDEAHSIGALGATGRGVTEYCGVNTADVDIMMGTFTKSFGGMGGYIAADAKTIEFLRVKCAGSTNHNAMSPVVCQQVLTSLQIILGEKKGNIGVEKIEALKENSNFFRAACEKIGLHVYGDYDSPIIPVLLYNPTKILAFSRECFKRGLAVVVVGFPATPVVLSRARFCVSAAHTKEQITMAVEAIAEVAGLLKIRYGISSFG